MLYLEMDIFCGAILILLLSRMLRRNLQQYSYILFQRITICALILCLLDATWKITEGQNFSGAGTLNLLVNCGYYLALSFSCYYWFLFSENEQDNDLTRTVRGRFLCALPLILLCLLNVISLKSGWIFSINEQNQWQPGPYLLVQILICNAYILLTALKALYKSFHAENLDQHDKFLWLSFYAVPLLLNALIIDFTMDVATTAVTTCFSILMIYTFIQDQHISLDPLTRLNNRYELRRYLHDALKSTQNKNRLSLLVLDIDHFKSINDKYGHIEGDKALVRLADTLRETNKTFNCFCPAMAGMNLLYCTKPPT